MLTVTADNQTKVYGSANPALTFQITGYVNGDDAADLTTPPTCSTVADESSSVAGSPYAITCSGATDETYAFNYVAGELTVTRASLTITADNQSRAYGVANPVFTSTPSGFVNGENASVLTTPATCSSTATPSSSVAGSPYAITCSGAVAANYAISYVAGTLAVSTASLTITANNQSRAYGVANPAFTSTPSGFVNGENASVLTTPATCSSTAVPASGVAGSPYAITCSGAVAANYTITYVGGQLTVTQAPLTVTADAKSKVAGSANPALTATLTWVCVGSDVGDVGCEWCGVVFDDGDGGEPGGFVSDHVCGGVVGGGELLVWSLRGGDVDGDGCVGVSVQSVERGGDAGDRRARVTPASVELGVKFTSSVAGFVTGVRFYKGAGNGGHPRRASVDDGWVVVGDGDV